MNALFVWVALIAFIGGWVLKDASKVGNVFIQLAIAAIVSAVDVLGEKLFQFNVPVVVLIGVYAFVLGGLIPKVLRFFGVPLP